MTARNIPWASLVKRRTKCGVQVIYGYTGIYAAGDWLLR